MNRLIIALQDYLDQILASRPDVRPWPDEAKQPHYLRAAYQFFTMRLFDFDLLLAVRREEASLTPTQISTQVSNLTATTGRLCVFVDAQIKAYNRHRLIERKVQFIIPGTQMYLPALGADLREQYQRHMAARAVQLSPASQAALLHIVLNGQNEPVNSKQLKPHLQYTAMTLSRALDEFGDAKLGDSELKGRERWFTFTEQGKQLWERSLPLLRDPVRRRVHVLRTPDISDLGLPAGLTALAKRTQLAEPKTEVRAIAVDEMDLFNARPYQDINDEGPHLIEFEVWTYDPKRVAGEHAKTVDPLSLFLSLRDHADERVEGQLTQMMENLEW